ncbi:hypothetical protein ACFVP0_30670 [Streptomyces cinereoruber]|uniref:hypothetical protein n=1 Tax=Streptomyces cinereoruber TaxID=67260 RepID=UPI0036990E8C
MTVRTTARDPWREVFDSPAWMALNVVGWGLAAGSGGTSPVLRVAAAVLLAAWTGLLVRHFWRRFRRRTPSGS